MNKLLCCAALVAMLSACASNSTDNKEKGPTLTANGEKVLLMNGNPPAGCKQVDEIKGGSGYAIGSNQPLTPIEKARINLRNAAAKKGANLVVLERQQNPPGRVILVGQGYTCP